MHQNKHSGAVVQYLLSMTTKLVPRTIKLIKISQIFKGSYVYSYFYYVNNVKA